MRWVSKSSVRALVALVACGAAAACGDSRGASHVSLPGGGGNGGNGGSGGAPVTISTGGLITIGPGTLLDPLSECGGPVPGTPLTRWSIVDLDGTLDDLFGPGTTLASTVKVADDRYQRNLDYRFADALRTVAQERVLAAVADTDTFEICDEGDDDPSCIEPWLRDWGGKLYRRPLTVLQTEAYVAQFRGARRELTAAEAARNALVSMILSPYFALRIEIGDSKSGALDDYEVAARLSSFATRRAPDAELRASAAAGTLQDGAERLAQFRRLRSMPAGHAARALQHLDWLGLSEQNLPPTLEPELRAEMLAQTSAFIDDVFEQQGGTLSALLASSRQPLTPRLAEHYGLSAPAAAGLSVVDLDASLYGGILTQGLFLSTFPRPTQRGIAILQGLFCSSVPAHPAEAAHTLADGATPRERIKRSVEVSPACQGCHDLFDPAGFVLDAFDEQGRLTGFDTTSVVQLPSGMSSLITTPGGFGQSIAAHPTAQGCAARHYIEYVLDRELTPNVKPASGVPNTTSGPPPIPNIQRDPEVQWAQCLMGSASLTAAAEQLVQSIIFTTRWASVRPVVVFDTSVDPLEHALQETRLFSEAFLDVNDQRTLLSYLTALRDLQQFGSHPGAGGQAGAGGEAGAGGAAGGPEASGGAGAGGAP